MDKALKIEICLAANAKYFPGMFVAAASIAMHARRDCFLSFNLLETDVADADYNELVECIRRLHADVEFHRFNVERHDFSALQSWHGNKLAYARFLIGELRPDIDFVIYSDVDMLWLADVAELWKLRDENVSILGPYDGYSHAIGEDRIFEEQGYAFDASTYYCSGLLLMNLKRMRENRLVERCVDFLRNNHAFICPDQSALNIMTVGDSRILPRMWMKFTFDIREWRVALPIVIHYANELPWIRNNKTDLLTDTVLYWFGIYAKARGETPLMALRRFFSWPKIIFGRLLFVLVAFAPTSLAIHIIMVLFRRAEYFWAMKKWARRVMFIGK